LSNDRHRKLLRGQGLMQLADNVTLRVIGDYFDAEEKCCDAPIRTESGLITSLFASPLGTALFGPGNNNGVGANFAKGAFDNRTTNVNRARRNDQDQWGLSGELNWDADFGTVTYISAYRDWDSTQAGDDDYTFNDIIDTGSSPTAVELVSQEVRIRGEWEWLDWLVGGYYLHEEIRSEGHLGLGSDYEAYADLLLGGLSGGALSTSLLTGQAPGTNFLGTAGNNRFSQDSNSYSLFTHNIVDVGQFFGMEERLRFTGGFRYTWENKDGQFKLGDPNNPGCDGLIAQTRAGGGLNLTGALTGTAAGLTCFPFVSTAVPQFNDDFKDDQASGTAKLSFDFTDEIMGYVSFSRGFKSGGFNLDSTAAIRNPLSAATIPVNPADDALPGNYLEVGDPSFDSETINAYEVGVKTDLFGNRVRANGTFFYYDIDDFQVLEFTGVAFQTENVKEATVFGFEFESTAQLFEGFELMTSFTYSDAKYSDDCVPDANGSTLFQRVCGLKLTNAPPWVVNLGFNYTAALFPMPQFNMPEDVADFIGRGDVMGSLYFNWQFRDDRRAGTTAGGVSAVPGGSEAPNARIQKRTETIDMRLSLHSEDYSWAVEVWGRNLTDERSSSVLFAIPLRTGATGGFLDPPRMYGFTVRALF
jgi:outer membrane receptor protein involved in Fe transport